MRTQWLARRGTKNLTLVFGGWGLGVTPFTGLVGPDDVLFVDDYTRIEQEIPETDHYDRVRLLAYSFGVASAAHWMDCAGVTPARKVAVNGTLYPADETRGIPPETVAATADGLTVDSFAKFCRRAGMRGPVPVIDIPAAQTELRAIAERGPCRDISFDAIWISERDRIVPTQAQMTAWKDQAAAIRRIPKPHQPFEGAQLWQDWLQ